MWQIRVKSDDVDDAFRARPVEENLKIKIDDVMWIEKCIKERTDAELVQNLLCSIVLRTVKKLTVVYISDDLQVHCKVSVNFYCKSSSGFLTWRICPRS